MGWFEFQNLPTRRMDIAERIMAGTASLSYTRKPVFHLSISFAPGDPVNEALMKRAMARTLSDLGPAGRLLFVADGNANARVVEYTADRRRVRECGERGSGPGQFNLPHSLVVGEVGTLFIADRENGRVQRFDLEGRFLGAWPTERNPYSLALVPDGISMGVLRSPGSGGPANPCSSWPTGSAAASSGR